MMKKMCYEGERCINHETGIGINGLPLKAGRDSKVECFRLVTKMIEVK